jgi:hypothetical protein
MAIESEGIQSLKQSVFCARRACVDDCGREYLRKQLAGICLRGESEQKPGLGCGSGWSGRQIALSLKGSTPQGLEPMLAAESSLLLSLHALKTAKGVRQGSMMLTLPSGLSRASSDISTKSTPSGSRNAPSQIVTPSAFQNLSLHLPTHPCSSPPHP